MKHIKLFEDIDLDLEENWDEEDKGIKEYANEVSYLVMGMDGVEAVGHNPNNILVYINKKVDKNKILDMCDHIPHDIIFQKMIKKFKFL